MAQSDLNSYVDNEKVAQTASQEIQPYGPNVVDADAAAAAQAAGVIRASFIDYDVALNEYTTRDDIESLAAYNARTRPVHFSDADYVRARAGSASASEPHDH